MTTSGNNETNDGDTGENETTSPRVPSNDVEALSLLQRQWIEKQATIAVEMGIERPEDIAELIRNMTTEEFRSQFATIQQLTNSALRIAERAANIVDRMFDTPTRLASLHAAGQEHLQERIITLAQSASPEELSQLAAAYALLPAPYTQAFYRPLNESDVIEVMGEPTAD